MSPQQETDRQLVERVQRGDKKAFDILVLKYQHKIIGLVSRYLRNQDEVQDVTQEAFIKAYRALPRFRGDSAFYTWLYRIAINTAKNHLVSRSRRPPDTDIDIDEGEFQDSSGILSDIQTPENQMVSDQLEAVVYKAIDDLPEELKVAVTLREFEGLSYEEIADIMGCHPDTIRNRFSDIISRGKANGKMSVRRKMMETAMTGNPTMLIWLSKNWLGMSDTPMDEETNKILPWSDDLDATE